MREADAADPIDAQALCNADAIPDAGYLADADPAADAAALSLARIRQLAAHEVGHALGFEHNFAASTYGRASVMDYPAPLATLRGDQVDLSQAYATSIGRYDEWLVRYAYSEFAPGTDEPAALDGIVRQGLTDRLLYVDDDDGRPLGAAHPLASLWDNGDDAVAMLRQQLAVRHAALERFGLASIPNGQPLSLLEARLVPLYLHHRFQLQAALKWVGGLYFTYAVKEQGKAVPEDVRRVVPGADQRRALTAVLDTLDPAVLTLPQRIVDLIPPPASGYTFGTAELFPRATSPAFDPDLRGGRCGRSGGFRSAAAGPSCAPRALPRRAVNGSRVSGSRDGAGEPRMGKGNVLPPLRHVSQGFAELLPRQFRPWSCRGSWI